VQLSKERLVTGYDMAEEDHEEGEKTEYVELGAVIS
jgi:hypothetical protein